MSQQTLLWFLLLTVYGLFQTDWAEAKSLRDLKYSGFQAHKTGLTIKTAAEARLQLQVMREDVIRVWFDPSGKLQKSPSLAVMNEQGSGVAFEVDDEPELLRLRTSKLELRVNKSPLRIEFYTKDGRYLSGEDKSSGFGWRDGSSAVYLNQNLGNDEHFYGLGEDNDAFLGRLDRRGSRRDMWTNQEIRKGHVTADIPVTFFMSTGNAGGAYGMFFDNAYRSVFDMGASSNRYWSWQAEGGPALYYFIYGPEFKEIINRYTELTGRPTLPPLWALGFIQSKCCYWDFKEIDEVRSEMRQRKIPFDVMVIDYNWSKVPMDFQWAERWGKNIAAKLSSYEQEGTRVLLSNAGPMIRKDASNYQDGLAQKVFASDGAGNTVTCGHYGGDLLDFTADHIKDWLWPQLKPLYEQGIDGWWLDLTEPEGEPSQTVYQAGPRAGIHNSYSLLSTRAYYEMQTEHKPSDRAFILTRTGTAGIQRYGAAIWTGDTWSDYATFMAHVPEALNTGLSGIPWWTNDTGGFLQGLYKDNLEDHGRLYERWLQFSIYSPITRVHHVGPSAPYMFGPEVESSARHYINERYRLLPYIYSYSWQAAKTGAPLMRPLIYSFQDDPEVRNLKDQYLFGEELLVAPVLTEGAERRKVYVPRGSWIDQDNGQSYQGPGHYCMAAPRQRIPVLVRSGAIIPKAPLMQYTGEKAWDPLTLEIYPEGKSSFTLYQDDGESTAAQTAAKFTTTEIHSEASQQSVLVRIAESNKLFVPQRYQILLHLKSKPLEVRVNDRLYQSFSIPLRLKSDTEQWFWNSQARTLSFFAANSERLEHRVEVKLDSTLLHKIESDLKLQDCPDPSLPSEEEGGTKGQIPHFFPPPSLPGQVQAENYDKGGEGIAWHDNSRGNQGGEYREDDVDIIAADDLGGGAAVADTEAGEWYEYTVSVTKSGFYDLSLRFAGGKVPGALHLERDERALTEVLTVPAQANGEKWRDLKAGAVYLQAGEQILRLTIDKGGFLLNHLSFTANPAPKVKEGIPLCRDFKGGFGEIFNCFSSYLCKKQNEVWPQNKEPASWCVVHELGS